MIQKRCIEAGEQSPDFILKDQNNREFKLSDFQGKRILLSFHPLAWTPVCADQMKSLEKNWSTFEELNTVAVGISVDPVPSKKAWANTLDITHTRLLSDFWPHGDVSKLYGLFREKEGFSERANIIVNENLTIEFVSLYELGGLPDIEEILTVLKTLQ
ncbi:MAG: redoxin domain-containing protein [Thermoplasmatales archaeon]|nr:MAG: redoxin domain-containing protein [Thermoplasmatales archaeon]